MLQLTIPLTQEGWDEAKEEFIEPVVQTLRLEHSLVSLSKWESKWCKPFLSDTDKTSEETLDYIKFMTITRNVPPEVYDHITEDHVKQVTEYINASMTAATFLEDKNKDKSKKKTINGEMITAETLYYWMISLNIPFECQKWHLNRLITLIRFCSKKNEPNKKMSMSERKALNAARKKKYNTKG